MNYNHNILTTYQFYDSKLRIYCDEQYDLADVEEFEDMADMIYKTEILEIFGLNDIDDLNDNLEFNEMFNNLFQILYPLPEIKEFVEKIITNHIPELPDFIDEEGHPMNKQEHIIRQAFAILFSYQYFFISHKCVRDMNTRGELTENSKSLLRQIIFNV
jgi:protein associated with RNAse G/E